MTQLSHFAPLLLALVLVLFLYAHNFPLTDWLEASTSGLILLGGVLVALIVVRVLVKDALKSAAVLTLWLAVFFFYGHVRNVGNDLGLEAIARHRYMLPAAALLSAGGAWAILRSRGSWLAHTAHFATTLLLILVAINFGSIGWQLVGERSAFQGVDEVAAVLDAQRPGELADVYLLVLDAYARADVLQQIYGFDNSSFLESLRAKGFFVATESRSNYMQTGLSLSSALNLRYLDDFQQPLGASPSRIRRNLLPSINDSQMRRILKSTGYRYAHFSPGWGPLAPNSNADIALEEGLATLVFNEFSRELMSTTLLWYFASGLWNTSYADVFNANMQRIKALSAFPEPTFALLHSMPPHPPYLFDREGTVLRGESEWEAYPLDPYVEQLVYVNQMVGEVVSHLLTHSASEPIIIIMSDHGPATSGSSAIWNNLSAAHDELLERIETAKHTDGAFPLDGLSPVNQRLIWERTANLAAYYVPEDCPADFYPSITPVNALREIMDACIGTNLGQLEDRVFFSSYEARFQFVQVDP